MKIFLLNGPPGAGKDTAANFLSESVGGKVMKFAEPLKSAATAIYFGGNRRLFNLFDTFEMKGKPDPVFFGDSCRQVQIAISEDFLKRRYGSAIFGRILTQSIKRQAALGTEFFFVSDSGFKPEAEELVREFGAENIVLIRIHREGHTYAGDSRGYIELADYGVNTFDVDNSSDVDVLFDRMLEIVNNIVGVDR